MTDHRNNDSRGGELVFASKVSFACLACGAALSWEFSGDIWNHVDVRCECGEIYETPKPQIKVKWNFSQADMEWRAKHGRR